MLSVVTLIVGIPFTILSGIIAKILDFRAKKIDNLMSFIFYLLITIIVIGIFIYPNYILAYSISKFLENLLTIKCNLNLGVYSMGLFIFISLLKLEVDAFYRALLFIKQRKQSKSINKILKVRVRVNVLDKNISYSNFDIKNHLQKKSDTLKIEEDKLKDEISYDITYLKNTLRKAQLAILILFL